MSKTWINIRLRDNVLIGVEEFALLQRLGDLIVIKEDVSIEPTTFTTEFPSGNPNILTEQSPPWASQTAEVVKADNKIVSKVPHSRRTKGYVTGTCLAATVMEDLVVGSNLSIKHIKTRVKRNKFSLTSISPLVKRLVAGGFLKPVDNDNKLFTVEKLFNGEKLT